MFAPIVIFEKPGTPINRVFNSNEESSGKCIPPCYAPSSSLRNSGTRHFLIQNRDIRIGQGRSPREWLRNLDLQ